LLSILLFSCEKIVDNGDYTQEQLNGTWEAIEKNWNDCTLQLAINDSTLHVINICSGVPVKLKADEYSFNGKILRYSLVGINYEYEVLELTEDKLFLGYDDPDEYFRVNN
jgi:hypothetical protein